MWIDPPKPVIDPVCGATLEPGQPRVTVVFRGRRFFFCGRDGLHCRRDFKRAPERWADARPEAGLEVRPSVPPAARGPSPFNIVGAGDSAGGSCCHGRGAPGGASPQELSFELVEALGILDTSPRQTEGSSEDRR